MGPSEIDPPYEKCSDGRKLMWNATLVTNASESDVTEMKAAIADAFSSVERWDLVVDSVRIEASEDEYLIYVRPPEEFVDRLLEQEKSVFNGRKASSLSPSSVRRCPGCGCARTTLRLHPDNGCDIGTVERIMEL
jgi:hypothetical protein